MKTFWLVGVLWVTTVFVMLFTFTNDSLTDYDAQQSLIALSSQSDFDSRLVTELQDVEAELAGKVLHFTQPNCFCNQVAEEHIASVVTLANQHDLINVTVSDVPRKLTQYIPSTPSVAVFDSDGKLSYLGPYSAGYSCLAGNGLVESFIKKVNSSEFGATVISQVRGCYCSTTPT